MGQSIQLDRRRFLQRAIAAMAGSAAATLVPGCGGTGSPGGGGDDDGPPPGGNSLAAVVTWGRIRLDMTYEFVEATVAPTATDVVAWLGEINDIVAETHNKAAASTAGDLRINVDPTMEALVTDVLDARGLPLRFTGQPPQYTVQRLQEARARADAIVAGQGFYARWSLWAFIVFVGILHPEFDDATLLARAERARLDDYHDVAGQIYDVLVTVPRGTLNPMLDLERDLVDEATLLVYQALRRDLAGEAGALLGVLLPALLFYFLAVVAT